MQKWEKFSDEELLEILQTSHTYADALRKLGYKPYTSMNYIVKKIEEKVGYQIEHSQLQVEEKDILGQKFGKLTIISLDKEKSKANKRAWVQAQCECGNIINVSLNALRRGNTTSCGCYNKEVNSQRNLIDMTGQICGRLEVIKRDESRRDEGVYWLCRCNCGNSKLISVGGYALRKGITRSCGCLQKERAREIKLIDLTNQRFGNLIALERDDSKQQDGKTYWKCKCDCGNIVYVQTAMLNNGNTSSCGCRKESYGEQQIKNILTQKDINFVNQFSFQDLIGDKRPLKFDFAIFKNDELKYLIECNGRQHYQRIEYFQTQDDFKKQQDYDKKKILYCKQNNIPLITIDFSKNRIINENEVIRKEYLC